MAEETTLTTPETVVPQEEVNAEEVSAVERPAEFSFVVTWEPDVTEEQRLAAMPWVTEAAKDAIDIEGVAMPVGISAITVKRIASVSDAA